MSNNFNYIDSYTVNSNFNPRILKKIEIIFDNSNSIDNILPNLNNYIDFNYSIELERTIELPNFDNSIKINYIVQIPHISTPIISPNISPINNSNSIFFYDDDNISELSELTELSEIFTNPSEAILDTESEIIRNYRADDLSIYTINNLSNSPSFTSSNLNILYDFDYYVNNYYNTNNSILSNRYNNNYNRIYDINEYNNLNEELNNLNEISELARRNRQIIDNNIQILDFNVNSNSTLISQHNSREISLLRSRDRFYNLINRYTEYITNIDFFEEESDDDIDDMYHNSNVPNEFLCPISLNIMKNPVISIYGHTYEKKKIIRWIKKKHKCPMTNRPLYEYQLIPNIALKNIIDKFI